MIPDEKNINELDHKLWFIVLPNGNNKNVNSNHINYNQNDHYNIKFNDVIKLGRVKYVITEVKIDNDFQSIEHENSGSIFDLIMNQNETIDDESIECLFCLHHKKEDNSPLFKICKCKETLSIHHSCIKEFVSKKLNVKNNNSDDSCVISYNLKDFNCTVCRTPYPCKFLNHF